MSRTHAVSKVCAVYDKGVLYWALTILTYTLRLIKSLQQSLCDTCSGGGFLDLDVSLFWSNPHCLVPTPLCLWADYTAVTHAEVPDTCLKLL